MLKIIRSRFSASARGAYLEAISRIIGDGRRAYLIVPEQQTVMAEAMMAKALPPSAVLSFEVTNFTRLANTTFRSLGGLSGEYCDTAKKSLIMWRTLTELAPTLNMTAGRNEINAGLVESCISAVSQMQNLGISPNALSEATNSEQISGDARLLSKVSDISAVYALYKKLLGERYADTGDDANAMIKKLEENPEFLSDTAIFIDGFTSFTEPQYRLIALLADRCDVSVYLELPKGKEKTFEYSEIYDAQRKLVAYANKKGCDVKLMREEGYLQNCKESLDEISLALWGSIGKNDNITLQNSEDLRIFEAKTPYDECTFVCEDIKRRVMNGAKYSDFAIIARSAENYRGILDGAFSESEIPAFLSVRRDINEFEAIKLIYTAYATLRGFSRENVISYAKCSLSGISRAECDEFEMYVNKWQINGSRFTDGDIWNMNPEGYQTFMRASSAEKLVRIDAVRQKIMQPLSALASRVKSANTVREHAEVLLSFLLEIEMEEGLERLSENLKNLGEGTLAEENSRLWKVICDSLDTVVTVLGDCPADADSFLAQLKTVFSATDIGRIPAYVDRVTVGSADMLRLYDKKHIYLIGVNAGAFPASINDSGYFSEKERRKLNSCGIGVAPKDKDEPDYKSDLEIKAGRELYIFTRAFSYATESVTITYPALDTRFKAIEPSDVIGKIISLTGNKVKPMVIEKMPLAKKLFSPLSAVSRLNEMGENLDEVRRALFDSNYSREVAVCDREITNTEVSLNPLLDSEELWLTQSKIDSYVSCPFQYFCKYVINIDKDERAEFDAGNIGSFVHAILENFFRELEKDKKSASELTDSERVLRTREAAEKHLKLLGEDVIRQSVSTRIKIDRLHRAVQPIIDVLCEEFAVSSFTPKYFELSVGKNKYNRDSVYVDVYHIEDKNVYINGKIDRVDKFVDGEGNIYLRVVDYKTGKKEFDPEDMEKCENLQMFIYMKAIVEGENKALREDLGISEGTKIHPAGVLYAKTGVRDLEISLPDDAIALEIVKDAQRREGMILDTPEIINATTIKYSPMYDKRYPNKIPDAKRKYLYSEDEWKNISETVDRSIGCVADRIRSGNIEANPKEMARGYACDFCKFMPICRKGIVEKTTDTVSGETDSSESN